MAIAFPVTDARRAQLASEILLHVSPDRHREAIIQSDRSNLPEFANCRIHLKAGQGWSVAPFRLLRDYSIVDPYLTHLKDYGCYTYFLLGAPNWWARLKNLGWKALMGDFGGNTIYCVRGSDVVGCSELVFYRPDDKVVVIRGDYTGPAYASPEP